MINVFVGLNVKLNIFEGEYKVLVCIFLVGGNDSFNMLVLRSKEFYWEYSKSRFNLVLFCLSFLFLDYRD